jgi:hypothetical protein
MDRIPCKRPPNDDQGGDRGGRRRINDITEEAFEAMQMKEIMKLFLPEEKAMFEKEFTAEWSVDERKKRTFLAAEKTLALSKREWGELQIKEKKEKKEAEEAQENDSDSDGSGCPREEFRIVMKESGPKKFPKEYEEFIAALPKCVPFYFGFHVHSTKGKNIVKTCYCPFSKKLMTWRNQCNIAHIPFCSTNKGDLRFYDYALVSHLEDSSVYRGGGLDWHKIALWYIQFLNEE